MNQFICAVEKELGYRLKLISGGNSSMLPQLMYNDLGKLMTYALVIHYLGVKILRQVSLCLIYINMRLR